MAENPIPYNTGLTEDEIAEAFDNALNVVPEHTKSIEENTTAAESVAEKIAILAGTVGTEKRNYIEVNATSRERYGITATVNEDGSITLNGTNTAGSAFMLFSNLQTGATPEGSQFTNNKKWIPTGEYIMSQGGVTGATLQLRIAEESGVEGDYYSCSTAETAVTIGEQHNYVWCRILISTGATFDNVTLYPMIRLATDTDTTYRAYQPSVQEQLDALLARVMALEAAATTTTTTEEV